jgi:hypothetical protein
VKGTKEVSFEPIFWFTNQGMEDYMGILARGTEWETAAAMSKFEAFCVAGCDASGIYLWFSRHLCFTIRILGLNLRNADKVNFLKTEIRGYLNSLFGASFKLLAPSIVI